MGGSYRARVLDALLLIDEPIEGLIKFLLIDRCEASTAPSEQFAVSASSRRAVASLDTGSSSRATIMAMDNDILHAGCRPPCDSTRSSLSLRSVPSAAATCPCGSAPEEKSPRSTRRNA